MKKYIYPSGAIILFGGKETVTEEVTVRGVKTTATVKIDKPAILAIPLGTSTRYFEEGPNYFRELEGDEAIAAASAFDDAEDSKRAPKE